MDRSFAARLTRPFAMPATLRGASGAAGSRTRSQATVRRGRGAGTGAGEALRAGLPALAAGALEALRWVTARVWAGRRTRVAVLCALIAMPVLAGGWLALRDSSFVAVQRVRVSGVRGPQAQAIEAALVAAGKRMSTLDVKPATLRAAVASYPLVREVKAVAQVPHGLRIEVLEQPPVAALQVGSLKTAVAADGVVLGPALLSSSLPAVRRLPSAARGRTSARRRPAVLPDAARRGSGGAGARGDARVLGSAGPDGDDAQRPAGVLRRHDARAREVAVAGASAGRRKLGGSELRRRAPAGAPRGGVPGGSRSGGELDRSSGDAGGKESESAVAALAQGLAPPGAATAPASPVEPAAGAKAEEPSSSGAAAGAPSSEKPSETSPNETHETPSGSGSEAAASAPTAGG